MWNSTFIYILFYVILSPSLLYIKRISQKHRKFRENNRNEMMRQCTQLLFKNALSEKKKKLSDKTNEV